MKSIENLPDDVKASILEELSTSFVKKDEFDNVLKSKQDLLDEVKVAKRTKAEIEAAAETARMEAAAKNGDIESLRTSYEEKLSAMSKQIDEYNNAQKNNTVLSAANEFINREFVEDQLVREAATKEYASRLDIRDGQLVVLDAKGNLTANTLEDLQNEFKSSQKFAKHLVGSRASGGSDIKNGKPQTKVAKQLSEISINDKAARLAWINSRLNSK